MTILKSIFCSLLLIIGLNISAQNLDEGSITIELTEVAAEDEQMAAGLEMMKGSSTNYFFNSDKSLVTMDMMGGMVKTQVLVANATEDMLMLFDMMGNKMMVESTKEEREKMEDKAAETDKEITYDENDTKVIQGYTCKKATVKSSADDEMQMEMTMYVTEEITASPKMIRELSDSSLKGFPLEYTIGNDQFSMTYTTTEIKKELDPKVFELKKAGYAKMTFEEFQEQMQSMGGGMGF